MKGYHAQLNTAIQTALSTSGYTVAAFPAPDQAYPFIQTDQFNPRDWGAKGCYGVEVDIMIHAWDKAEAGQARVYAMLDQIMLAFPESFSPAMTDWRVARCILSIPGQVIPNVDREVLHGIVQVTLWIEQTT